MRKTLECFRLFLGGSAVWCLLRSCRFFFQYEYLRGAEKRGPLLYTASLQNYHWKKKELLSIMPLMIAVLATLMFVLLLFLIEFIEYLWCSEQHINHGNFEANSTNVPLHPVGRTMSLAAVAYSPVPLPPRIHAENDAAHRSYCVSCFCMLIGLAWEAAFERAEEEVIQGMPLSSKHFVIASGVIAAFSVSVVVFLWRKFIVPKAVLSIPEHQKLLEMELMTELAGGLTKDTNVRLARDVVLNDGAQLQKGTQGRVVGAPSAYFDSMVKCSFPSALNVDILEENLERLIFPDFLGPFDIALTRFVHADFISTTTSPETTCSWTMGNIPKWINMFLDGFSDKIEGEFSPVSSITPKTRERFKLPGSATHFAFSYPANCSFDLKSDVTTSSPELAFLSVGGFVSFEKKQEGFEVVQVTSLIRRPHGLLKFGGKQRLKEEWTEKLKSRFRTATLPFLQEQGVRHFCWICPEEQVGSEMSPYQFGAFVYVFNSQSEPICFEVSDTEEAPMTCTSIGCTRKSWNHRPNQPCCRTCQHTRGKYHGLVCEQTAASEQSRSAGESFT
eukprot:TRINITY_DN7243_c0_g1_i4.p1 TRINITY_DN7243_c0_g1~~TRINITY_DN7243_c0_g1_i4.p1  ORF type:complete len:559 (-),score=74.85 TRINITY_DN7243_c0_g1_i4:102-1778(-)